MTIQVLLADDHPIVRSGIKNELERHCDIQVIGEASSGTEVLRLAKELSPDVLLIDIYMPGVKTVRVLRELCSQSDPPQIAVLTAYSDVETVIGMLKAGATGYILKDEDPSRIIDGVQAVAAGLLYLSETVLKKIVDQRVVGQARLVEEKLSAREIEVLKLLARGVSNHTIAQKLSIAEGTVKNHVTNIYSRLGVRSRVEAAVWAWENGVVERGKR